MFLTCVFKLHNPSKYKRDVMDRALYEYTVGYQQLLDWAQENLDLVEVGGRHNGKYTTKSVMSVLPRLKLNLHSSVVDSLLLDVAGNLVSYLELKEVDDRTSFPVGRNPDAYAIENSLENFILVGSDEEDYTLSKSILLTVSRGSYMPLFFGGADGATRNRRFSLFTNTQKRQLLAGLWLLPKDGGKPIGATEGNLVRLDTGEVFTSNSKTAILVLLEVGRNGWQEYKFLQPCLENTVRVKTATLIKKENEYFLHIAFEFPEPKVFVPEGWLGVDQGILVTAAYAVIDKAGQVIDIGHEQDDLRQFQIENGRVRRLMASKGKQISKRHYKQQEILSKMHQLINNLIKRAVDSQAGIVIEDLNPEFKIKGKAVFSRFKTFEHILTYKCKLNGVPLKKVFAAYSSRICPCCGEDMERSEDRQSVWCLHCGFKGHADETASINIARRALYKKSEWSSYREFHRSFAH